VRVLLSDGSSLASRQIALQLSGAGHSVGVLSADPLCLSRFTRHVRRVHRVPSYGRDPLAWLAAAVTVVTGHGYDVLFPTQEQVAVLAADPGTLARAGIRTAVPPFASLAQVQDKVSAFATLARLGLPQPPATVVTSRAELLAWRRLPAFVKLPIGTATAGVRRVTCAADLDAAARQFDAVGAFGGEGVLVQDPLDGPLVMVQAVFDSGVLVASHANLRLREGARGGASHKQSVDLPVVRAHLEVLGRALAWHGACCADAILTDDGPRYIDVNPRLVEPGNAHRAGVDLVGALLDLACGRAPAPQPPGPAGVRTHQLLLAVLGAAQFTGERRRVVAELVAARRGRGSYEASTEELTPVRGDPEAVIPLAAAVLATLVRPASWRLLSSGAVAGYALTPQGWRAIVAHHLGLAGPAA